jgi:hypothetical protein
MFQTRRVASRDPLTTLDRWHHNTVSNLEDMSQQNKDGSNINKNKRNSFRFHKVLKTYVRVSQMLNLANKTSKFCKIATFAIVNLKTIQRHCSGMSMYHLCKIHIPNANETLVTAMKKKLKTISMWLLFCCLQFHNNITCG